MNGPLLDYVVALARRLPYPQIQIVSRLLARGEPVEACARELPDSARRDDFISLAKGWLQADGSLRELAAALGGAARAAAVVREEVRLEPVWTGPLPLYPQVRRTDQVLIELITTAQRDLLIVSFVTYHVPQIRAALREALDRGVKLTFVLEDSEVNPDVEDQDPARLLGSGYADRVTRLVWPMARREDFGDGYIGKLHAKCAVADDELLLIGSANLTQAALLGNIELGLLVRGGRMPGLVRSHFSRLTTAGELVPVA